MSRIEEKFTRLKAGARKGFIPFVTAGDPDVETSLAILLKLADLGADVIELGVPFSDPMADGPTIQRSSQRALANGVTLEGVIKLASRLRQASDVPVVLFSYLNPLLRFGFEPLAEKISAAGIDGVLITDAVDEEARKFGEVLRDHDLDLISLIAPTTTDDRLKRIADNSSGFLYAISRAGVTGARDEVSSSAAHLVQRARRVTDLPIAVGFGLSTGKQISDVWGFADAAVVGSAIVGKIEAAGQDRAVSAVEAFVRGILPEVAK